MSAEARDTEESEQPSGKRALEAGFREPKDLGVRIGQFFVSRLASG
jgi:hypothetical protein